MKKLRSSKVIFADDIANEIELFEWKRMTPNPDYSYRTDYQVKRNPLQSDYKAIELSKVKKPFIQFKNYFNQARIMRIRHKINQILEKKSNTESSEFILDQINKNADEFKQVVKRARVEKVNQKIRKFLSSSRIFKIIVDTCRILSLPNLKITSLRKIAIILRMPIGRVAYLVREVKKTKGQKLLDYWQRLQKEVRIHLIFKDRLDKLLQDNFLKTCSLKVIHKAFEDVNSDICFKKFGAFYKQLRGSDFRYKSLQYHKPSFIRWTSEQKDFARLLCFELWENKDEFQLLWVDETTVCPQNFQKKGWGLKGKPLVVRSNLQYDQTKLYALMSRKEAFSLQFLQDTSSHFFFDTFIIESMKKLFENKNDRGIVVLFLDNAAIHRSRELFKFCETNKIILIFNLPYCPTLNPIELLWRYIKRPFKNMTDNYSSLYN